MTCYHPIDAWQADSGGPLVFWRKAGVTRELKIACGQCMGCRLKRSERWAVRCIHEAKLHEHNSFITLTYNDDNCPKDMGLDHRFFELFMKRFRKAVDPIKLRYYMCGEYGPVNLRPHFHALIFGYDFPDKKQFGTSKAGHPVFRSAQLERLWPFGFSYIGAVSFESAGYVARYCTVKVTGDMARAHYTRLLPDGTFVEVRPEYNAMSLGKGVGRDWLESSHKSLYNRDWLVIDGVKRALPKYYDQVLERSGYNVDLLKKIRSEEASEFSVDNTPERLKVREEVHHARIRSLSRGD